MVKVNMNEAKTTLSKLVERALGGEEIVLANNGKPLVMLVPVVPHAAERPVGLHPAPLSDQEAQAALRPLSDEELGLVAEPGF